MEICCLKYYFEDYLKDYGFVEKEKERIAVIKEVDKRIAAYRDLYIKKFGGIQKFIVKNSINLNYINSLPLFLTLNYQLFYSLTTILYPTASS